MKKNANFPILLLVIVLVAVTAQFTRPSGEKPEVQALRKDMVSGLTRLWGQPGHQVEALPAGEKVNLRVSVSMPPRNPRQQRWNYPFLRYLAARHPAVALGNLSVLEAGNERLIPELALAGLMADRAAPRANFEDEEERLCQLTARQVTSALGARHVLVLVDAQLARSSRDATVYGAPDLAFRIAEPIPHRVMVTEICVVSQEGEISPAEWEHFRAENPQNGAPSRLVILP